LGFRIYIYIYIYILANCLGSQILPEDDVIKPFVDYSENRADDQPFKGNPRLNVLLNLGDSIFGFGRS
jgi:hypothetical protein